jgi:hypothetical protein
MIKKLVKVKNDFYLIDDTEPTKYTFHKRKFEILKVDGVGEISGEVFHEKGFSFKEDCANVLKTTNEKIINIPKLDRGQLLELIGNDDSNIWIVDINENDEIVKLKK